MKSNNFNRINFSLQEEGGPANVRKSRRRRHALKDSENEPKTPTPPPNSTPTPTLNPLTPFEDIFSSKKHSMNYVTVDGVKLRTGYSNKTDWYFLCIKELLDNTVDFLWDKYKGAKIGDAVIDVYIEKTSESLLRIKVKNSNPRNVEAFTAENLSLIFDFDMTAGSKQNLHIISRGVLGDAMKQILALPYVLIHAHDDGSTFANRQWEHPLIIRSNKKEFHVPLYVDLANQIIQSKPIKETDAKISSVDTEIEVTLPIIEEVRDELNIHAIKQYCREYPIFTTDISFKFKLVDNSPDNNNKKVEEREEARKQKGNGWIEQVDKAISSPAPKAAIKIEYPALHSITEKWNNRASVHSYKPGEFTTFLESVHNKTDFTVYQRINQLAEGTNSKKLPELEISIAELLKDKSRHKKEEKLFWHLRTLLSPPRKLSLPYKTGEQRKTALVKRIARLHEGKLDTKAAVYKSVDGFYKDDIIAYPYQFEIIAIPYNEESIDLNLDWLRTVFSGCVNYSVSPRANLFESRYNWEDPKRSTEFSSPSGANAQEVLQVYNFKFYKYADSKVKLPCVIFANLVTPRVDYHGADKSRIDTTPFSDTVIVGLKRIADNIKTYRAAGYIFETKSHRSFNPVKERKKTADTVIEELLKGWM